MQFLEHVARNVLGEPQREGDDPHWNCPFCGAETKFHVMPENPKFKSRYYCFDCRRSCDAHDLLQIVNPIGSYGDRLAYLAHLKTTVPSPRGNSRHEQAIAACWADIQHVLSDQCERWLEDQCDLYGCTLSEVMAYDDAVEEWSQEVEERHMAECNDPDCEAACCRGTKQKKKRKCWTWKGKEWGQLTPEDLGDINSRAEVQYWLRMEQALWK